MQKGSLPRARSVDIDRLIDELRGKRKACIKKWKVGASAAKTLAVAKRDAGLTSEEGLEEVQDRILMNAIKSAIELQKYGKTGDFLTTSTRTSPRRRGKRTKCGAHG